MCLSEPFKLNREKALVGSTKSGKFHHGSETRFIPLILSRDSIWGLEVITWTPPQEQSQRDKGKMFNT